MDDEKRNKFTYDFQTYDPISSDTSKNVESNCADILFVNRTDGTVLLNNFQILSNDSLSLGANENELNVGKFQLTNLTATAGIVYVIRKRYL